MHNDGQTSTHTPRTPNAPPITAPPRPPFASITIRRRAAAATGRSAARLRDIFSLPPITDANGWHTLFNDVRLSLEPAHLTAIVGPSGCGKSTLLNVLTRALPNTLRLDQLPLPRTRLIDGLKLPIDQAIRTLAHAGLSDAPLMLHRPGELSDGQRYRYRLALAVAHAQRCPGTILLADEFLDTLDRITARVLASTVRRWVTKKHITLIVATSKLDLIRPLRPDTLIEKPLLRPATVVQRRPSTPRTAKGRS